MSDSAKIIKGLQRPEAHPAGVDRIELIETHISAVLLAGPFAYKIKKPLNLGFLDFSTLERRRFCCDEEIRLNRRLAPDIYLGVVPITGTPEHPVLGGTGEAIEYAVKMLRFEQDALLSRREVTPAMVDRIAERVAQFHREIPLAEDDSEFGEPEAVLTPMTDNFGHIRERLGDAHEDERLGNLLHWTRLTFIHHRDTLQARKRDGFVRECHGDMHRSNIATLDGKLVIFDAIEFNPRLRWIDTMSEVAFLVMDLDEAGAARLAQRFLNRYLEICGDFEGLAVLRFYQVYRAMVRAKVTAIRASQPDLTPAGRAEELQRFDHYLRIAAGYTHTPRRRLFITYGVSGSGKTRLGRTLREHLVLIHIRSDVERKRLFGMSADARSDSAPGRGIYAPHATAWTYQRLFQLAKGILSAGYSVLVDATFLRQSHRALFQGVALAMACDYYILCPKATEQVLRARVIKRQLIAKDASEADLAVLESQLRQREPLTNDEKRFALTVDTESEHGHADLLRRLEGPSTARP